MPEPLHRDCCEEHNRGDLSTTDGLCPDCEERSARRQAEAVEATPSASPPLDCFIEARQIVGRAEDAFIAQMRRPYKRLPIRAFECFRDEIARALAAERERCAKIAEGYALRAADSAQVVLANAAEEARAAISYETKKAIEAYLKDKQNFLHGKRHCAVEITKAIRDLATGSGRG